MSTPDGRSLFDLISSGYTRTVSQIGSGTLGVCIPKDLVEEKNINHNDEVVVRCSDDDDSVIELHFESDEQ